MKLNISELQWLGSIIRWHKDNEERGEYPEDCGYCEAFVMYNKKTRTSHCQDNCPIQIHCGNCFKDDSDFLNCEFGIPNCEYSNHIFEVIKEDGKRLGYWKEESDLEYKKLLEEYFKIYEK